MFTISELLPLKSYLVDISLLTPSIAFLNASNSNLFTISKVGLSKYHYNYYFDQIKNYLYLLFTNDILHVNFKIWEVLNYLN